MDLILITSKRFIYTSLVSYFNWNLILGHRKEIHTHVHISWTFPYCHFWIKHWQQPYERSVFGSSWLHLRNETYTHLCSLHAHILTWAFTMITWTSLLLRSSQDSLIICSTMHGTKKLIIYGRWISTAVTYIGNRYWSKNREGTLSYQEQALGHQGKYLLVIVAIWCWDIHYHHIVPVQLWSQFLALLNNPVWLLWFAALYRRNSKHSVKYMNPTSSRLVKPYPSS